MYPNLTDFVNIFGEDQKTATNDIVEIEMEEFNKKVEAKKGEAKKGEAKKDEAKKDENMYNWMLFRLAQSSRGRNSGAVNRGLRLCFESTDDN